MMDPAGLTTEDARQRLVRYGPNTLPASPPPACAVQVAKQLLNPLVLALLAACGLAVGTGLGAPTGVGFLARYGDAIAILLIVVLNALLGTLQERRARGALESLRDLTAGSARVRREGRSVSIPTAEVVPDDVLELQAGDAVAADAVILRCAAMAANEAALTGESESVAKQAGMPVRAGTTIVRGTGLARVTATGRDAEIGRISELVRTAPEQKTPLQERLERFGAVILWVCLGVSAALVVLGLIRGGRPWSALLLEAVSLAVAAIPEGLPAITTITLALGMQRMARQGALVRHLAAVETLGAATVLCCDKTGTLTRNQMTVREAWHDGRRWSGADDGAERWLTELLESAVLCNDAHREGDAVAGDPVDAALLVLAERADCSPDALREGWNREHEAPFEPENRRMSVGVRQGGRRVLHVKGAVETVLGLCSGDEAERTAIAAEADAMGRRGLKVLLVAARELDGAEPDWPETGLECRGLVGLHDPPREGVVEAVARCESAGLRTVMITGDHPETAVALAREIGLWRAGDEVVRGDDLHAWDDARLAQQIMRIRVFARTTAEQKMRLVRAFKGQRQIVAMTGDGVNDAPALREAHIGVAMGRHGTDVAREAADMVLADDNYATIVRAVLEGRAIFRNIQKVIFFLLSSNMGLVVAVFAVSLAPSWLPLTPLMILWINLVTNGSPALGLGVDPPQPALMAAPPRAPERPLLEAREYLGVLYVGAVMGAAGVAAYLVAPTPLAARTMGFCVLALAPLLHAFSCRSPHQPALPLPPGPWLVRAVLASAAVQGVAVLLEPLRPVFHTVPLGNLEWGWILLLSAATPVAVEAAKAVARSGIAIERGPLSGGTRAS